MNMKNCRTLWMMSLTFSVSLLLGQAWGQALSGQEMDSDEELALAIKMSLQGEDSSPRPSRSPSLSPSASFSFPEDDEDSDSDELNSDQESMMESLFNAALLKVHPNAKEVNMNPGQMDQMAVMQAMLAYAQDFGADEKVLTIILKKYQQHLDENPEAPKGKDTEDGDNADEAGAEASAEAETEVVPVPKAETVKTVQKAVGGGIHFAPLENLGNTCYINASFKILADNKEFIDFLANKKTILNKMAKSADKKVAQEGKIKRTLSVKLKKLLDAIIKDHSKITDSTKKEAHAEKVLQLQKAVIKSFKLALTASGDTFGNEKNPKIPGSQYDSPEFVGKVLDYVQYTANQGIRLPSLIKKEGEEKRYNFQTVAEPILTMESFKFDKNDKPVGINSTQEILNEFFKKETATLGGGQIVKQIVPLDARNSLLVQLKRTAINPSNFQPVKIATPVDLGDITFPVYGDNKKIRLNATYTPSAVVVQSGGASGGHYYTYIKNSAGQWVLHDDNSQPQVDLDAEADIQKNGYLILFKLVKKEKP